MKRLMQLFTIVFLSVMIVACASKINQENYDKITNNMSMQQVTKILGKPTSQTDVKIGAMSGSAAMWQHKQSVITLTFMDDKVVYKNFSSNSVNKLEINP